MGLFLKEAHQGKKKKGGALGPWAGPARVRILGGLGPTLPSRHRPSRPLGRHPRLHWWRGKVHPPIAYIKGAPREEGAHKFDEPLLPWPPTSTSWCAGLLGPPPSTLSLSLMASRRAVHVGDHTTAARCRAAEFPDPCPTPSTSAILAGMGIPGVIVIAIRVRVRRGAAHVAPESLLQELHDLEVGYVVFIVNACAGA
jgi:hypothetical protein